MEWCRCANRLQLDLKRIGHTKAIDWIVHLCKTEFNLVSTDGQSPASLSDVISIVKQPSWYNKDRNQSRLVIYMLSYGIFRNGYNGWANDASTEWMSQYQIAYHKPSMNIGNDHFSGSKDKDTHSGKVFDNRLVTSRASNTISNRFQEATKKTYHEYLCVHVRDSGHENIQPIHVRHFNAFLVTVPSLITTTIHDSVRAAVVNAHRERLTQEVMLSIVHEIYAATTSSTLSLDEAGKYVYLTCTDQLHRHYRSSLCIMAIVTLFYLTH